MSEIQQKTSNKSESPECESINDGREIENKKNSEISNLSETTNSKTIENNDEFFLSETKSSSQELAETTHEKTKQEILSEYSQYMSKEHIERLEDVETKNKILPYNVEKEDNYIKKGEGADEEKEKLDKTNVDNSLSNEYDEESKNKNLNDGFIKDETKNNNYWKKSFIFSIFILGFSVFIFWGFLNQNEKNGAGAHKGFTKYK